MTDFNAEGQRYEYQAFADSIDSGVLGEQAEQLYRRLNSEVATQWSSATRRDQERLAKISGCLSKLRSVLLQAKRMAEHSGALGSLPTGCDLPPGSVFLNNSPDACSDFESLVIHSRAALDRLSSFIGDEHRQSRWSFTTMQDVFKTFSKHSKHDARSGELHSVLNGIDTTRLLVDDHVNGRGTSLRSKITHYQSVQESISTGFIWHRLNDGGVLKIDSETDGHPIISTSWKLNQIIPYVVMNALCIYIGIPDRLTLDHCEPSWSHDFISLREYRVTDGSGMIFTTMKANPGSFTLENIRVRIDLLGRAQPLQETD